MKRLLLCLAFLLLPTFASAQVTNPLTKVFVIPVSGDCDTTPCSNASKSLCRESGTSTDIYACDTGTGFYVPVASAGVQGGSQLNLEGPLGDTYLIRDVATGFIMVYLDGTLKATITPGGVIPGDCPTDIYSMELGTQCMSNGELIIMTQSGPWQF